MSPQKPRLSVASHHHFQRSIAADDYGGDEIDRELDEITSDPILERYCKPRKASQTARVLRILDDLERGGE